MLEILKMLNLIIRFLLELGSLAIFGYWGFKTGNSPALKFLLGLGAPLLFAGMWGTFLAPKAPLRLSQPWVLLLELLLFGLAGWALYSAGKFTLSLIFGAIYILNKILMVIWRQ